MIIPTEHRLGFLETIIEGRVDRNVMHVVNEENSIHTVLGYNIFTT